VPRAFFSAFSQARVPALARTASSLSVLSKLKHGGVKVHQSEWCIQRGRGLSIAVLAPISETSPGTFEMTIQVGDPSIQHPRRALTYLIPSTQSGNNPRLFRIGKPAVRKQTDIRVRSRAGAHAFA
jgi:hypothetical protein